MFKRLLNFGDNLCALGFFNTVSILVSRRLLKRKEMWIRLKGYREPIRIRLGISDEMLLNNFLKDARSFDIDNWSSSLNIVDAGANIGLFCCLMASRMKDVSITAIEPDPDNLRVLKLNTKAYPNITIVEGALWNKNEKICILNPDSLYMSRQVGPSDHGFFVQGLSLFTIMENYGIQRIDLLKMDIEGSEYPVVLENTFFNLDVVRLLIEIHPHEDQNIQDELMKQLKLKYRNYSRKGEYYYFV